MSKMFISFSKIDYTTTIKIKLHSIIEDIKSIIDICISKDYFDIRILNILLFWIINITN